MASEPISALPAVASAQLTDIFPAVQGGVTSKITLQQVLTLFAIPTFPLPMANGGTAKALVAANGGVVYSDADSLEILAPVAAAGKMLQSGNNAAPTWSTPTYPNTSATANTFILSDGTNYVASTLQVPNTTTAGQEVRTGGTANVLAAFNAMHFENIQVFTADGTFNVPTDVNRVYVIAQGSGGGGGGGSAGTIGSGGGSGSYSAGIVTVTPGGTVAVTVGAGGAGGAASGAGSAGNDSSFGASIIGKAGGAGITGGGTAASGTGGVAGTGTITAVGNPGQGGGSIATCLSGMGGGSPMFGGGGPATTGAGGNGAANTGGGGAGGRNANGGGNGGSGIVVVYY